MTVSEMVELEEVQALLARGQEHGFLATCTDGSDMLGKEWRRVINERRCSSRGAKIDAPQAPQQEQRELVPA